MNAGQIPQLLYRVNTHEGSVAPKQLHDSAEPVPILSKSFYITVRNVSYCSCLPQAQDWNFFCLFSYKLVINFVSVQVCVCLSYPLYQCKTFIWVFFFFFYTRLRLFYLECPLHQRNHLRHVSNHFFYCSFQDVFQSLLDLLGWAWTTLRTCVGEVSCFCLVGD